MLNPNKIQVLDSKHGTIPDRLDIYQADGFPFIKLLSNHYS